MRLGKYDSAGNAVSFELVEQVAEAGEPGTLHCVNAKLTKQLPVSQVTIVTSARIQIGDKMKTIQFA